MAKDDYDKEVKRITKRAVQAKKQELAEKKANEREAHLIARAESKASMEQNGRENKAYTVVVIAKLEYAGENTPTKEQLAEDLGHTIMKWVSQKEFYAVGNKEAVPKLVSVDVDVK